MVHLLRTGSVNSHVDDFQSFALVDNQNSAYAVSCDLKRPWSQSTNVGQQIEMPYAANSIEERGSFLDDKVVQEFRRCYVMLKIVLPSHKYMEFFQWI